MAPSEPFLRTRQRGVSVGRALRSVGRFRLVGIPMPRLCGLTSRLAFTAVGALGAVLLILSTSAWAETRPKEPRTDLYGDPLPEGAIARFGSIRFRHDTLEINSIAFSPDGKLLASCGGDTTVRIWAVPTGRQIHRLKGHTKSVRSVAFSPDGRTVASAGEDGVILLWDLRSGKQFLASRKLWANILCVRFSPDGATIAVATEYDGVYFWRPSAGAEMRKLKIDGLHPRAIAFSPDGNHLAVVGSPSGATPFILLFEVPGLRRVAQWNSAVFSELLAVDFSPDGTKLAAAFGGRLFGLWDVAAQEQIATPVLKGPRHNIRCIAFSPDGRTVAVPVPADKKLVLYELAARKNKCEMRTGDISSLAFSPDGTILATAGNTVRLWSTRDGTELLPREWLVPVLSATFSCDGKTLNSGSAVYETETGRPLHRPGNAYLGLRLHGADGALNRSWLPDRVFQSFDERPLEFKTEGALLRVSDPVDGTQAFEFEPTLPQSGAARIRRVHTCEAGNTLVVEYHTDRHQCFLSVLAVSTGKELSRIQWPIFPADDPVLRLSPDGRSIAGVIDRGSLNIAVWDSATGTLRHEFRTAERRRSKAKLLFSSDSKYLAGVSDLGENIVIWDVFSGRTLQSFAEAERPPSRHNVQFSPDDRVLAYVSGSGASPNRERFVRLRDIASGKQVSRIPVSPGWMPPLHFSPDGRFLATSDSPFPVWEIKTAKPVVEAEPDTGYAAYYTAAAFSSDSRLLALGTGQGNIGIWELTTGKRVDEHSPVHARIQLVAFSPDGTRFLTVHADRTALLWDTTFRASESKATRPFEELWTDLAHESPRIARRAVFDIVAAGDAMVSKIRNRLRPIQTSDDSVQKLIGDLSSPEYAIREEAFKQLEQLGGLVEPALKTAVRVSRSPETRKRAQTLLERLQPTIADPEIVRAIRAVEALERVGTRNAVDALRELAKGSPSADQTRAAVAALARLNRH